MNMVSEQQETCNAKEVKMEKKKKLKEIKKENFLAKAKDMKDMENDFKRLRYPRVSEIIGKQTESEMRNIPIEYLTQAGIRGTVVHEHCTSFSKGLWLPNINPQYEPYVEAFIEWYSHNVYETIASSVRFYDDENRFTGEFDLMVIMKDNPNPILVDIKTSCKPSKSWPLQLAAYRHLCRINGYEDINEAKVVHIKKVKGGEREITAGGKIITNPPTVKLSVIDYPDLNEAWEIFSSATKCYHHFHSKEEVNV